MSDHKFLEISSLAELDAAADAVIADLREKFGDDAPIRTIFSHAIRRIELSFQLERSFAIAQARQQRQQDGDE